MTAYDVLKDFAGPLATVCAAATAVGVTLYFNQRSIALARTQRDIALDKLRFDAWEKRYDSQARELLSYLAQQYDFENIDSAKIRELRVKIDEARFFFGPSVRTFLSKIDNASETFLMNLSARYGAYEADDELIAELADKLANDTKLIRTLYAEMPEQFEHSLRLSQLTRD